MIKKCPVCKKVFESMTAKKFCSLNCRNKAYNKPKRKRRETLCWTCQNATGQCSWSKNFTPVEGWDAVPTKVRGNLELDEWLDSYLVIDCPKYRKDLR